MGPRKVAAWMIAIGMTASTGAAAAAKVIAVHVVPQRAVLPNLASATLPAGPPSSAVSPVTSAPADPSTTVPASAPVSAAPRVVNAAPAPTIPPTTVPAPPAAATAPSTVPATPATAPRSDRSSTNPTDD